LQPGKADAGQLFTSSVSSTAFGPRGTQTILAKITIGAAITFMVVALLLTMGVGGDTSLMKGVSANPAASPTPAAPAAPPAAPAEGSAAPAPQTESSPAQGTSAPAPATTPAPAAPQQK
jgi:protein translocase SecG subunit